MSVFATGNMSLYASNEEEEDFICSAPQLWDQFPTRKALLITLDAVCSQLGAPGTMLVCKMLNRLWEVSSCMPAGVQQVLQQVQHARNKFNEGGNEAFLNMIADISLPETKRSSYFKSWFYEDQKGPRTLCTNEQGDVETKGFVDGDQLIEMWRVEKFVAAYRDFKSDELREQARNVERERQLQLVREEKMKLMASATAAAATPSIMNPPVRQNLIDIVLLSEPGPNRRINAKEVLMCKPADAFKVYRDSKFKFVDEDEAEREILQGRRTARVVAEKLNLPQDKSFFKVVQGKPQIMPAASRVLGPGPTPQRQIKPFVAIAPRPAPMALPAPTIVAVTGGVNVPTAVAPPSLQQQPQKPMMVRAVVPGGGISVLRASLSAAASARMPSPAAATSQKYIRQQQHLMDFKTMYYDIQKKYFNSLENIRALTNENKSLKIGSEPERLKSLLRANFVQGSHIGQARSRLEDVVTLLKQIESDLDDVSKNAVIKSNLFKAIESVGEAVTSLDTQRIKVSLKRKQQDEVSYGSGAGTENGVGAHLAKKLRPDPCVSQTMGYARAFLAQADQVRLAALETARALYRRQNLVEDKDSLDGLFQCHMVSWKMRHRLLTATAAEREGSSHREAYLSAMTDQVIGMIESQMNAKTFNYHGGVNVWRNYKSVCKTIDNTLNKLIQAEMRASGAGEHDALADEVDPSVFNGRVSTLPLSGDVSMQDLQNAKEKFLSFTRKLNDIVVSFTADGKILTSHDMRRVALLAEVNLYETYSLLKKSGIMANDYALKRARAWANKSDESFVAATDRKFFEKFSEAVVELSKDFNFVTGAESESDPLGAGQDLGPGGFQTDHEEAKEGIQENDSVHGESSRKEDGDGTKGNGLKEAGEGGRCDNDAESAEVYDSATDSANDDRTDPAGDDEDDNEYYGDDFTPIECEQVMEEGVDPLDEVNNGVAEENEKDTGDVVMLE